MKKPARPWPRSTQNVPERRGTDLSPSPSSLSLSLSLESGEWKGRRERELVVISPRWEGEDERAGFVQVAAVWRINAMVGNGGGLGRLGRHCIAYE